MAKNGNGEVLYETVLDAIRAASEKWGNGQVKDISFSIPLAHWPLIEAYIKKYGKSKLQEELICLCADQT